MSSSVLSIMGKFGSLGVNVDINPTQRDPNMLQTAENAISDPLGGKQGISNRPGLINFNPAASGASILGGVGVPLVNHITGTRYFFIGRGPTT